MRRLALTLLLAGAVASGTGCDGSSPTETGSGPPRRVVVQIQDPAGAFGADHAAIRGLIEQTAQTARSALSFDRVTFLVRADSPRTVPGYGIGGYTLDPQTVEIVVDPAYPGLSLVLAERLPPVVAHELHHTVRLPSPGYGVTLLEVMVSEGLADHFAMELLGTPLQPWSMAFPESDYDLYLDRARPLFDSGFDFGAWFFGTEPGLPRWTGYTLGYGLVAEHQARTGRSAAELVHTPAEAFRPD